MYSVMFLYVCVSNAITIVHTAKDAGRAQKGKETIFFYVWLKKMDDFFFFLIVNLWPGKYGWGSVFSLSGF